MGCLDLGEERDYEATSQNCKVEFLYTYFCAFGLMNTKQWAPFVMVQQILSAHRAPVSPMED